MCVKEHTVYKITGPFRVQYEKILSLESFYTHAVADKYQVCLCLWFRCIDVVVLVMLQQYLV